jgi:hypothetical protein
MREPKRIPSLRHERAVPDIQRKGFAAALRKHTGVLLGSRDRIIPDAFDFDTDRNVLTLYEVEVTHFLAEDPKKMDKLRLLRDFLPHFGWRLRVRLVSSDGHHCPIDWATGAPKIGQGQLRYAVRLLDTGIRP